MRKNYSLVIALSISLFIYVFYRTDKTAVNQLFIYFLSLESYILIKNIVVSAIPLKGAIVYSLPGGLWVFCATTLAHRFYFRFRHHKIQIGLLPVLFAVGLEFCQLTRLTPGIFDVGDVTFYVIGWMLSSALFNSLRPNQNILSPLTLNGFTCLSCFFCVFLAHVSR
ncbi:MAG: hypothetical protein WDO14_20130 [Bacteroidota bacterium]